MKEFYGTETHVTYPDPTGNYIEHIDCWAKMVDDDTILVSSTSGFSSRDLDDAALFLGQQTNGDGQSYSTDRVSVSGNEAYSNSLILNNHVYVPIRSATDTSAQAALAVYEEALPGREVVGVVANNWQSTDALHCRTREVPRFR
jgi:agmatine/peptidylarginine deiminase